MLPAPRRIPEFATVEEERLHRKQRLAMACRIFSHLGLQEGGAGHITARDPARPDEFWILPFGFHFGHATVSSLIRVSSDGKLLEGRGTPNTAAIAIHAGLFAARPDLVSIAHSHTTYGKAFSTLGRLLAPITQDACAFFENLALFNEYTGVVTDASEGARIAAVLGPTMKAAILQNHGLLTSGATVEETIGWFIRLERCCQVELLACAAGTPTLIPVETARSTRQVMGSAYGNWFSVQPLFDALARDEPDVFE